MILNKSIEHMKLQLQSAEFTYGSRPEMTIEGPVNAYVHVPFCMTTCDTCPYYKTLFKQVKKNAYLQALLLEIINSEHLSIVKKLTIGGGTPNLLTTSELKKIIDAFRAKASIETIQMEALPSLLNEDYLRELKWIGVNTLVLGLESFTKGEIGQCGRMAETLPHMLKIIKAAKQMGLATRVGVLTGVEAQRETSFVEDVHLIAEMKPEEIRIRPLIKEQEDANDRTFELVEIAAEILMEKGYLRTGIWQFSLSETLEKDVLSVLGFGPSAYTLHEDYMMVNPELDLYMHEQVYGQRRVIVSTQNKALLQWRHFIQELFLLDFDVQDSSFTFGKWFKRWMQISGGLKQGRLNEKGIMDAHALVYTRMALFPRPVQNPELIHNSVYYLAECAFAKNFEEQYELARKGNQTF